MIKNYPSSGKFLLLFTIFTVWGTAIFAQSIRHATLQDWSDDLQQLIYNRDGYFGGRSYEHGLFRFFTRQMDHEYDLDLFTIRPTPIESHPFWNSDNALQNSFGSLNYQQLTVKTKFRNTIDISNTVSLQWLGIQEESLRSNDFLFHPGIYVKPGAAHTLGLSHTLNRLKENLDITFHYRLGNKPAGYIDLGFSILDWANNLVYSLSQSKDLENEFTQSYIKQPLFYSLLAETPEHPFLRGQISAGIQPESVARNKHSEFADSTFTNHEQVNYFGALLEFYRPTFTAGAIYQYQYAKMYRYPVEESLYTLDFSNREVTYRLGFYLTKQFLKELIFEQWVWTEQNRDELWGTSVPEGWIPYDFQEDRLLMKTILVYKRYGKGFQGGIELNLDHRNMLGEDDAERAEIDFFQNYPEQIIGKNQRLTFKIGYHKNDTVNFWVGFSYDIDGKPDYEGDIAEELHVISSRLDNGFAQLIVKW